MDNPFGIQPYKDFIVDGVNYYLFFDEFGFLQRRGYFSENDKVEFVMIYNKLAGGFYKYRKEIILTEEVVKIYKAFKTLGYNYVAKNKNGSVAVYKEKPTRLDFMWDTEDDCLFISDVPEKPITYFLSWEDSEPTLIDDLIGYSMGD